MADDKHQNATSPLNNQFNKTEPRSLAEIIGDPDALTSKRAVDAWVRDAQMKAARYISANRETWLNEEREAEALRRQTPGLDLTPPGGGPQSSIEQVAQEKVSLRAQGIIADIRARRAERIEAILTLAHANHANAPERADGTPRAHPLKRSAHATIDRVANVMTKAHRHNWKMRGVYLANAAARGEANPERAVWRKCDRRIDQVRQAGHRVLDKSFQAHAPEMTRQPSQTRSGPDRA